MAALRTQTQVANQGRSLADFPEHADAIDRLTEIEQQLGAAQIDLAAAREPAHNERAEREAVAALLASGGVAVSAPPSVAELSQRVRILEMAARQQSALVSEIEARLEREVTAVDDRAGFDADVVECVSLFRQALAKHQQLVDRRASVCRRFRGVCSLPALSLSGDFLRMAPGAIQQFCDGARHFGVEGVE